MALSDELGGPCSLVTGRGSPRPIPGLSPLHVGRRAQHDFTPSSRKLAQLEEEAIVQCIIELSVRAFPYRLSSVEDMANQLLYDRNAPPVGKRWAYNFVKR